MSGEILILYGSRARGDARPGADVDLLLATGGIRPQQPVERSGVSLHRYPKNWLMSQASGGDLFAYHVGHEGVPLQDADGFLADLRSAFNRRPTYLPDARLGLLVARMIGENDWCVDADLRRRFFWGVRTCIISVTAETGRPMFAARSLEATSGINGLAGILDRRDTADFAECRSLLLQMERTFSQMDVPSLHHEALRAYLITEGGYPSECARTSEQRHWENQATVVTYA